MTVSRGPDEEVEVTSGRGGGVGWDSSGSSWDEDVDARRSLVRMLENLNGIEGWESGDQDPTVMLRRRKEEEEEDFKMRPMCLQRLLLLHRLTSIVSRGEGDGDGDGDALSSVSSRRGALSYSSGFFKESRIKSHAESTRESTQRERKKVLLC